MFEWYALKVAPYFLKVCFRCALKDLAFTRPGVGLFGEPVDLVTGQLRFNGTRIEFSPGSCFAVLKDGKRNRVNRRVAKDTVGCMA